MSDDIVRHWRRCDDCGREFTLEYNRRTGRAFESWQRGCKTLEECRKRILGSLSDFRADDPES